MSDNSSNDPAPNPCPSRTDRRNFLTGVGLAACAGLVAEPTSPAVAAFQAEAPKKKGPAPTSGIAGIKELLARKDAVAWVFTGDSITQGALHTAGWRSYSELFGERIHWELKRMRDIVVNTGLSGDKTDGLLADLDWRVLHLKPDVVSIMLGTFDCTLGEVGRTLFRKNLTTLVTKVMAAGAIPLLQTPNTIYQKNALPHGDLPAYAQVIREVATATKAALVDHYAHWEKAQPDQEVLVKWLADQRIHPNFFGHREIARQIFTDLGIFDENSPTCKLPVQ